jgi:gliding motility-associated lipoprotein GldD
MAIYSFQYRIFCHSFGNMLRYSFLFATIVLLISCRPEVYSPKPRGYFKIDLPAEHSYTLFNDPSFPYSFEYPSYYAHIIKDTSFFGQKPENPYWLYIDFPSLDARIYMSYKAISEKYSLSKLLNDSHELSYFNTKKADYIQENTYDNHHGVAGIFYTLGGNSASAYQFIATDSIRNFIRAGLYFNVTPNADSLKPVTDFLRLDMEHMVYTMRWK